MPANEQISIRLVRPLVTGLRVVGRDADELLRRAEIDPALLNDADAWVPLRAALTFWTTAAENSPPHMGLRLSEGVDFNMFVHLESITDYLLAQILCRSTDVGDAITQLERYGATTFGSLRFVVERGEEGWLAQLRGTPVEALPAEFLNFALAFPVRVIGQTAKRPFVPASVFFPYKAPESLETHRRVLYGAPLHFNAEIAGFRIRTADLAVPLAGASVAHSKELRARGDVMLAEIAQTGTLAMRIRSLIRTGLREGILSVDQVSSRMGLTQRTLARRLDDEGTSYRALVDEVRSAKARELLLDRRRPLAAVAAELGFADTPSFQRAFRRWFGSTPGGFRAGSAKTPRPRGRRKP
jgi:AraC-like DNA-binding protein